MSISATSTAGSIAVSPPAATYRSPPASPAAAPTCGSELHRTARDQAPDLVRGFFVAASLALRRGRGESRHARGEAVEPGDQTRTIAPPRVPETEIAIAERAGERDLTDVGRRRERGRRGFERRERALHLTGLMLDPFRLVPLRCSPAAFVDQQDRSIHHAVGERLQAQRGQTCIDI